MLGEYIKYMRIERGLSQKELAKLLFIAPCTLSHYEVGSRMIPYCVFETALSLLDYEFKMIDCKSQKEITKIQIEKVK